MSNLRGVDRRVPTPQEVQAAVNKQKLVEQLQFRLSFDGRYWIDVVVGSKHPLRNKIRPKMSILVFTLEPVLVTPTIPGIPGVFFITEDGFKNGKATWQPNARNPEYITHDGVKTALTGASAVNFGAATEAAAAWFMQKLAQAQGMRYRSHGFLTPGGGKFVYTIDP